MDYADLLYQAAKVGDIPKVDEVVIEIGTAPCDFSHTLLLGPRTGLRCYDCGYNVHERCREKAPKTCTKFKAPNNMQKDPTTDNFPGFGAEEPRPEINIVGPRPDDDNSQIIYQGYLYKQVRI